MTPRTSPPFRADHVGSLLRPAELLARARRARRRAPRRRRAARRRGRGDPRRRAQAGGGRPAVGHRRRVPPRLVAHGLHLPARRDHARRRAASRSSSATRTGTIDFSPAALRVAERRRRCSEPIFADDFTFLQACVTTATPKLTIPSPSMVHYRGGRAAIDDAVYPDLDEFWADLTAAYADEVAALGELGCTYLQFDDTSLAYLNDPKQREHLADARRRRRAPARDLHPPHQRGARGPARGHGGHDAHVPRQLPLLVGGRGRLRLRRRGAVQRPRRRRLLPRVRRRALGRLRAAALRAARASSSCSASSRPSAASSRARTSSSAASRRPPQYVDLDQLCLSPQCGFSSTVEGNALTEDEQWAKLRLIVETARRGLGLGGVSRG